jgi:hypothetical protein
MESVKAKKKKPVKFSGRTKLETYEYDNGCAGVHQVY